MRDYSKVSPAFWIGPTGKRLRAAGMEAQIVAMYLMTSPHANMLGLYYCPAMYIAHETGLGMEGASKGLARAIEAGFCEYDEASEVVWVIEMAAYQVGEGLACTDKRCKGVQNEYSALPENPYLVRFFERYRGDFHLEVCRGKVSPFEGASKPLASQEQEQEQEQEKETPLSGRPDADQRDSESASVADASAREAIDYLNAKTGSSYRHVEANLKLVRARLGEGATLEQVKAVIDAKVREWAGDQNMADYLRPKTLFNATNFANYVGQLGATKGADAEFAWWLPAGFPDRWEAENAGCTVHSGWMFDDGRKVRQDAGDGWVDAKRRIEAERRAACSA